MPYKKKTYRKKNPYSGSRRYKNYYRGGMQLYKDVMMLKNLINVEKKFIDTSNTSTNLPTNTTGTLIPLNLCSQGSANNNRTGTSIKMSSIQCEGFLTLNSLATNDYIRVALVIDTQCNGALPNYTNIYDYQGSTAPLLLRNPNSVNRYIVLRDVNINLATAGDTIRKFKIYVKPNIHTKYNSLNTGTISDVITNAVYLVFAGNLSSNFSAISYNCRVRFIDN